VDLREVFEEIAKVKGRFWAWAALLSSLTFLAWQVGFDDLTLVEEEDRSPTKIKLRHRSPPRVKRVLEEIPPWEPSEDFLDALLDESFRIRDIVVRFQDDDSMRTFLAAAAEQGLRVEDNLAQLRMLRIRLASGSQARKLFQLLPDDSEPEPNYPVIAPDIPQTEGVRGIAPFGPKAVDWLDAPGDRSNWGAGVLVAVLDTGVDFSHPTLEGVKGTSLNLVEGETDEASYDGHGTAVASIIAGNPDQIGGLAPKAEILSVRVLNDEGVGDGYTVAKGIIESVDRGADVINLSLGTDGNSFVLEEAIQYAQQNNVLVVASVGNDGKQGVTFPARYNGVIGVTAIDAKGTQASFSNYGAGVDIGAPGTGVHAAWSEEGLVSFSGTSAATPFVAGALAGLISENQAMPRERLPELLYTHANDDVMPGEDVYVGKGILDLGRVVGRNEKGTYDVAITGYYFDPDNFGREGDTPFLVSIQNQGTEWVDQATLEIEFGEVSKTLKFSNLGVGEVKSQELQLSAKNAKDPEGTRIASQLSMENHVDADADNNKRVTRITLPTEE
jgi:thermitase